MADTPAGTGATAEQATPEQHWEGIYRTRGPDSLSWYQPVPTTALNWIDGLGLDPHAPVVDVGAGASALVDGLLDRGHRDVTALDISAAALRTARDRLGDRAPQVRWVVGDLLAWTPPRHFALWHDRAVFHFLTAAADRSRYRDLLLDALDERGYALIATFAPDGPTHCSGLPVARWAADALAAVFAPDLTVVRTGREVHRTPTGAEQPFTWVLLRRGVPARRR
jgi:trans-aconitate methyltransferase